MIDLKSLNKEKKDIVTSFVRGLTPMGSGGSGRFEEVDYIDPEWGIPDQSIKADAGKLRLTLVPRKIIYAIAEIREYGNRKYSDPESWRRVDPNRYRDAAFRHFLAYLDDPDSVDDESGLSHLHHLACNIAFLIEMEVHDA